ncbi:hypothetical protein [Streptomyces vietnamensis]|uniref:hypothetical protein n=1 Tax=Streptomyces vietnamensis TaxID=362257 RepID=UPI00343CF84D
MHPQSPPRSHYSDGLSPRHHENLRNVIRSTQRSFFLVNAVPFGISTLGSFTDIPGVSLHGRFTLGILFAILQVVLFIGTAWWYETCATRLCDPVENSLRLGMDQSETPVASPAHGLWR